MHIQGDINSYNVKIRLFLGKSRPKNNDFFILLISFFLKPRFPPKLKNPVNPLIGFNKKSVKSVMTISFQATVPSTPTIEPPARAASVTRWMSMPTRLRPSQP